MHFTGIFALYCTVHVVSHGQNQKQVSVPRLTFLSVASLGTVSLNTEEEDMSGTITFDAAAYVNFPRDTFEAFDCNFDMW